MPLDKLAEVRAAVEEAKAGATQQIDIDQFDELLKALDGTAESAQKAAAVITAFDKAGLKLSRNSANLVGALKDVESAGGSVTVATNKTANTLHRLGVATDKVTKGTDSLAESLNDLNNKSSKDKALDELSFRLKKAQKAQESLVVTNRAAAAAMGKDIALYEAVKKRINDLGKENEYLVKTIQYTESGMKEFLKTSQSAAKASEFRDMFDDGTKATDVFTKKLNESEDEISGYVKNLKGIPIGMAVAGAGIFFVAKKLDEMGSKVVDSAAKWSKMRISLESTAKVSGYFAKGTDLRKFGTELNLTAEQTKEFGKQLFEASEYGMELSDVTSIAASLKTQLGEVKLDTLREAVDLIKELPKEQIKIAIEGTGTFDESASMWLNLMNKGKLESFVKLGFEGAFGDVGLEIPEGDRKLIENSAYTNQTLDRIDESLYKLVHNSMPMIAGASGMLLKGVGIAGAITATVSSAMALRSIDANIKALNRPPGTPTPGAGLSKTAKGIGYGMAAAGSIMAIGAELSSAMTKASEISDRTGISTETTTAAGGASVIGGAVIGGLVGALGGPIGIAIGAAVGGQIGGYLQEPVAKFASYMDGSSEQIERETKERRKLEKFIKRNRENEFKGAKKLLVINKELQKVSEGLTSSFNKLTYDLSKSNIDQLASLGGTVEDYSHSVENGLKSAGNIFTKSMEYVASARKTVLEDETMNEEQRVVAMLKIRELEMAQIKNVIEAIGNMANQFDKIPTVIVNQLQNQLRRMNIEKSFDTAFDPMGNASEDIGANIKASTENFVTSFQQATKEISEVNKQIFDIDDELNNTKSAIKESLWKLPDEITKSINLEDVGGSIKTLETQKTKASEPMNERTATLKVSRESLGGLQQNIDEIVKDFEKTTSGLDVSSEAYAGSVGDYNERMSQALRNAKLSNVDFERANKIISEGVEKSITSGSKGLREIAVNLDLATQEYSARISKIESENPIVKQIEAAIVNLQQYNKGLNTKVMLEKTATERAQKLNQKSEEYAKELELNVKYITEAANVKMWTQVKTLSQQSRKYAIAVGDSLSSFATESTAMVKELENVRKNFGEAKNKLDKTIDEVSGLSVLDTDGMSDFFTKQFKDKGVKAGSEQEKVVNEYLEKISVGDKLKKEFAMVSKQAKEEASKGKLTDETVAKQKDLEEQLSSYKKTLSEMEVKVKTLMNFTQDASKTFDDFAQADKNLIRMTSEAVKSVQEMNNARTKMYELELSFYNDLDARLGSFVDDSLHRLDIMNNEWGKSKIELSAGNFDVEGITKAGKTMRESINEAAERQLKIQKEATQDAVNKAKNNLDAAIKGGASQEEIYRLENEYKRQEVQQYKIAADVEVKRRKEILDAVKQEYEAVKMMVDLRQEGVDIEKDIAQAIGAPFETIFKLEKEGVQIALDKLEVEKNAYAELEAAHASSADLAKKALEIRKAEGEVMKKQIGAQRSAMEKMLGGMMSSYSKVGGRSAITRASKFGAGYTVEGDVDSGFVMQGGAGASAGAKAEGITGYQSRLARTNLTGERGRIGGGGPERMKELDVYGGAGVKTGDGTSKPGAEKKPAGAQKELFGVKGEEKKTEIMATLDTTLNKLIGVLEKWVGVSSDNVKTTDKNTEGINKNKDEVKENTTTTQDNSAKEKEAVNAVAVENKIKKDDAVEASEQFSARQVKENKEDKETLSDKMFAGRSDAFKKAVTSKRQMSKADPGFGKLGKGSIMKEGLMGPKASIGGLAMLSDDTTTTKSVSPKELAAQHKKASEAVAKRQRDMYAMNPKATKAAPIPATVAGKIETKGGSEITTPATASTGGSAAISQPSTGAALDEKMNQQKAVAQSMNVKVEVEFNDDMFKKRVKEVIMQNKDNTSYQTLPIQANA